MKVSIVGITGIPEIHGGCDLARTIALALERQGEVLEDGDILVVSSKVVSKALGLREPDHGPDSHEALVRRETVRVVAERRTPAGVTRVVHAKSGPTMTAAGVDASNVGDAAGFLVLPHDPDHEAATLRRALGLAARRVAVVITDTAGRPWRTGQTDVALGADGLVVLEDLRGTPDGDGRGLTVTSRAIADEVAAAADLVKGKTLATPIAVVRGLGRYVEDGAAGATALTRPPSEDWFSLGTQEAVRASLGVEPGSRESASIGIPSVSSEGVEVRLARAAALAERGCPLRLRPSGRGLEVPGTDPYEQGRLLARLEVALWGEGLVAELEGTPGALMRVHVRPA